MKRPDADDALAEVLYQAEQDGLRLAIKGRLAAILLLTIWFVVSRSVDPIRVLQFAGALGMFAILGLIHYQIIGTRYDRPWVKYLFITIDVAALSFLVATQPLYQDIDLPQVMTFRNAIFPYYFVILGVAAFSFSPGMVLWTGIAGVTGWLSAFLWSTRDMSVQLDWSDVPLAPTADEFLAVFFNPNFVGTGSRIQESVAYLVVAGLVAIVMLRARRTVRRQLELDAERRAIAEVFGRFVPPAVAEALINDRGVLEPVERKATILFVDLVGFTRLTETAGPQRIVTVLNSYFETVTRIVGDCNGVITQFQGDAILATFNVPLLDAGHAGNAVKAALAIGAAVHDRKFDDITLRTRAGICSGPVFAGSVGGGGRENYTVHGDTVNLAARLEALNTETESDVLVAESTVALLDREKFTHAGEINVRGLSDPVNIYIPKGL